eukprot:gnl/TRDRNA2_/TRDRNA2_183021_c0_seq1.p1 gnl/TRDRNA2_/TRDRNA2_183021_c0~~gnl/TRDRNA2_/TRDRNA2_183021_c0_seq1.p1  ORF type:complete len:493 (-),score=29.85 gnl/TRDRNA2_/TRDRNA2_183021_c0_seq1:29-1483(-)
MGRDDFVFLEAQTFAKGRDYLDSYRSNTSVGPKSPRPTAPLAYGNSAWLTASILVADVVGAGILSMAVAISYFGWLLGSVVSISLLAMNVHISMLMWRIRVQCPDAHTYMDLASDAFAKAPRGQRAFAVWATGLTQYSFIFLALGLYTLSLGRGLGSFFYDVHWCLRHWAFLGLLVLLPLNARSRSMGASRWLIWLNCATILGSVFIPILWLFSEHSVRAPGSNMYAVAHPTLSDSMRGLSIMSFASTSQLMVVEIISEMKDVTEFPKAYAVMSAPFQGLMFLIVGVGGYYFLGDKVAGMIEDNIPFGFWFRVAMACMVCHMLVTYLIKSIVFSRAIHNTIDRNSINEDTVRGWSIWACIVAAVMTSSWVIAQTVPFFTALVDLLGASLGPLGCFIIPIGMFVRWQYDHDDSKSRIGYFERAIIMAEFVFAILLIIMGTYFSMQEIARNWHTYGYPFDCHCDRMWRTCECSSTHPGMDQCLQQS